MTCNNCGKPIGRGKWCSDKCRKAFERTKSDIINPKPGQNPDKLKVGQAKSDKVGQDDWYNSAETKSQSEIESHYTEKNFPSKNIRYVMGGVSRVSPWKKDDPRSKAYVDQESR